MKQFSKRPMIYFKGKIVPIENALVNIMTVTAQYGINVFEGVRCYYNSEKDQLFAFRLLEHIERLFNSANLIRFDLSPEVTPSSILDIFKKVIKENNYKEDIYVKLGFFLDGEGSWNGTGPINMFIMPTPKGRIFTDKIGADCCIASWNRLSDSVIPPRVKSGANYLNSRFAHLEAIRNNYDLSIFLNQTGKVSEGTGACIFLVRNGKLITPPITASILESITRKTIIDIANQELNIEVVEREVDRTELYLADEVFFAGTSVEILPIISVDRFIINDNILGTMTRDLKEKYFNAATGKYERYAEWRTPIY